MSAVPSAPRRVRTASATISWAIFLATDAAAPPLDQKRYSGSYTGRFQAHEESNFSAERPLERGNDHMRTPWCVMVGIPPSGGSDPGAHTAIPRLRSLIPGILLLGALSSLQ